MPSSSQPFGAAPFPLSQHPSPLRVCVCVCLCARSQWHLITERTKAGGGPSGVNEIVTVDRRGSSVRDIVGRGAIQRTFLTTVYFFLHLDEVFQFFHRPAPAVTSTSSAFDSFAASASVENVQKTRIRAGIPGETPSLRGQHDPSPLFLPGVCRMKKA